MGLCRANPTPQQDSPDLLTNLITRLLPTCDDMDSNSFMQSLLHGDRDAPESPSEVKGPSNSVFSMASAAKAEPKESNWFLQANEALTAGRASDVGTGANPSAWFGTAQGGDGKATGQVARTSVDGATGTRSTAGAGAAIDWTNPLNSSIMFTNGTSTPGPDANGKPTSSGSTQTMQVGPRTVAFANKQTTDGASRSHSFALRQDGASGSFGRENAEGRGYAVKGGISDGRVDAGVEAKGPSGTSVGVDVWAVDKTSGGQSTNGLLNSPSFEVGRTTGSGIKASAGVEGGSAGIDGSVATSALDRVAYQTSAAAIERDFDPSLLAGTPYKMAHSWEAIQKSPDALSAYMKAKYSDRIQGVRSIADANLLNLKGGEGLTFDSQKSSEAELNGRVGAVSVGFGDKDLNNTRTSIARDEKGSWKIRIDASNSDADLGKLGLLKAVELGMESTTTDAQSVELTVADDEAGHAALAKFSATGLLPGAETLADRDNSDRVLLDLLGPAVQTLSADPNVNPLVLASLQQKVFEASARLNSAVLGPDGKKALSQQKNSSVQYTGHTTSHTEASSMELSILGLKLLDAGVTENWWAHDYREQGATETELGYKRDEKNFFAPNESTQIAVNPRGENDERKNPVEIALMSTQTTTLAQREIVDRVGAGGMDPAMRTAWANGSVHDGEKAKMAMVFTEGQLDTIQKRLGPKGDDYAQLQNDARKAVSDYDHPMLANAGFASAKHIGDLGTKGSKALIAKVNSQESFNALSSEERKQFLTFASQGAQHRDEWKDGSKREDANPWRALPLALSVKDKDERNELVRSMFQSIEQSSADSTTALLQLVDFLDQDGAAAGLTKEERQALTAGFAVKVQDSRVESRAKALTKDPANADQAIAKGLLADSEKELHFGDPNFIDMARHGDGAIEANRGDAMVDWLMAADQAGGDALLQSSMQAAIAKDPNLPERILKNTRHEPWRMETARNLLIRAGVKLTP